MPDDPLLGAYRGARKQYALFSGLLIAWALVGFDIKDTEYLSVKNPQAAPFVLLALVFYFAGRTCLEWRQLEEEARQRGCCLTRRRLRPRKSESAELGREDENTPFRKKRDVQSAWCSQTQTHARMPERARNLGFSYRLSTMSRSRLFEILSWLCVCERMILSANVGGISHDKPAIHSTRNDGSLRGSS